MAWTPGAGGDRDPSQHCPRSSLVPRRTAAGTQGQHLSGKQGRPGPTQRRPSAFTENMCPVSAARPPAVNVSGWASNLLLEHRHAARGLRSDTAKEAPTSGPGVPPGLFSAESKQWRPPGPGWGQACQSGPRRSALRRRGQPRRSPPSVSGRPRPSRLRALPPSGWGGFRGWSQPSGWGQHVCPGPAPLSPSVQTRGLGRMPELLEPDSLSNDSLLFGIF